MSNESSLIKIKAVAKLEKYPEGTTQEDIDFGRVIPEVIISEDYLFVTPEQAAEMGLIKQEVSPCL